MQRHLSTLFISIAFLVLWQSTNAQSANDPLHKPSIWAKIKSSPSDSLLWAQYVGKPWIAMSQQELSNVMGWRNGLGGTAETAKSEVKEHQTDSFWQESAETLAESASKEEQRKLTAKQNYIAQLESIMTAEPTFLVDLKDNVTANFILIEDVYREEFGALGITYSSYAEKHPEGGYSQLKWVEDRSKELKELKVKEFEKLKAQIFPSE